jgi:hypothetical protein
MAFKRHVEGNVVGQGQRGGSGVGMTSWVEEEKRCGERGDRGGILVEIVESLEGKCGGSLRNLVNV